MKGWISWGVFPDGRTGLSSLLDPLLEFLHLTLSGVFFTRLFTEDSSLDLLWSLLYSTFYWNLLQLTISGVFFARPTTGVFFTWHSLEFSLLDLLLHLALSGVFFTRPSTGVFFTWPSLEPPLLDPLLDSSSLGPNWSLIYLTLSGVFFTWPSLGSPLLDPVLESSSLDPLWSLHCSTLYCSLFTWPSLESPSLSQLLPSLCPGRVLFCLSSLWSLTLLSWAELIWVTLQLTINYCVSVCLSWHGTLWDSWPDFSCS